MHKDFAVKSAPPDVFRSERGGHTVTMAEDEDKVVTRFVREMLTDLTFLNNHMPKPKLVSFMTLCIKHSYLTPHLLKNPPKSIILTSPMLRMVVQHIYSTPVWQSALWSSPTQEATDRYKAPGAPSHHWSMGAPPALVAFAATIVSRIRLGVLHCPLRANQLLDSCVSTRVEHWEAEEDYP